MDEFEFNLEEFLTSGGTYLAEVSVPAGGMPINFDHKPDGYPGYCTIA